MKRQLFIARRVVERGTRIPQAVKALRAFRKLVRTAERKGQIDPADAFILRTDASDLLIRISPNRG